MTMHWFHAPVTRRRFISSTGALALSSALPTVLFAKTGGPARLVVVILRGALDGLAAVPPHGDPAYAGLHRELAIAVPGAADGALGLDGLFGLHPSLGFLHERYLGGELIVLHAVASPYRDRSHFDGQNVLENGLTQPLGTADGWLNRALATLPARRSGGDSERAVAISQNVPLILRGDAPVLSKSPLATPDVDEDLLARLADLYSKDDWFSARLSEAVQTEKLGDRRAEVGGGEPASAASRVPSMPAQPAAPSQQAAATGLPVTDRISGAARMAAALMRSEGGPEIAVIEAGGWDTHANQGGANGQLANRFTELSHGLAALFQDLGDRMNDVVVLKMSEFGRTVRQNGNRGTDHGHATCFMVLGGPVRGGRVYGRWPGLAREQLFEGRDLMLTTDYRDVFAELAQKHLGTRDVNKIFPNHRIDPGNYRGLIAT